MDLILYGLCFALLAVNFNGLDLLPDCVGYFLMYRGLGQLALKDRGIHSTSPWCLAMAILTLPLPFVTFPGEAKLVIALVFVIVQLRILFSLTKDMKELEGQLDTDLGADTMKQRVIVIAVANAAVYAFMCLSKNGLLNGLISLALMVVNLLFLMAFHRARLAYRAAKN